MTEWEKACKYVRGRKGRCILVILILALLILSDLFGLNMLAAAEREKKAAFRYNGEALCFDGIALDAEKIEALQSLEHVTGLDTRVWYTADIAPLSQVSYHTGADIPDLGQERYAHEAFLMTNWDVSQDSWFRWEPKVKLIQGEYPTCESRGVILEKRFAEVNHLQIGDTLPLRVEGRALFLAVCGLFWVDADFELLPDVDYSDWEDEAGAVNVYGASPYNRIYANAAYVFGKVERRDLGQDKSRIWKVYVDAYENVGAVAESLRDILGEEAVLYDNASGYLESSASAIVFMENMTRMIVGFMTAAGFLVLWIVMAYFAYEFKYETSLYLALGKDRRWVLWHDLRIFVLLFAVSLGAALGIYFCVGQPVLQAVGDFSNAYTSTGTGISYFREEGLEEDFSLAVTIGDIFSMGSLKRMAVGALLTGGAAMLIPSGCIARSRATDLFV